MLSFLFLEDKSGSIVLYSLEACNMSGRKTCKGSITVVWPGQHK